MLLLPLLLPPLPPPHVNCVTGAPWRYAMKVAVTATCMVAVVLMATPSRVTLPSSPPLARRAPPAVPPGHSAREWAGRLWAVRVMWLGVKGRVS